MMKSLKFNVRLLMLAVVVLLLSSLTPQTLLAQTVGVSPVALSFGIPTGTPPPLIFTLSVTVSITGTGPVTLSNFTVTPTPGDFAFNGNSCTTPQTAPTTCEIGVQFTSTEPAGTLETATLSFNSTTQAGAITVPLSGAYGAIKLFDETNITAAPPTASFTSPYLIANKTLNLSCTQNPPTATISGTPDGAGYVLVDNYITLATGPSLQPVNDEPFSSPFPPGNICGGIGSTGDDPGPGNYQDCFTDSYQNYAFDLSSPPPLGLDPDTFANPGNGILTAPPHSHSNAGGVPPIDVSAFLTGNPTSPTYPEQVSFSLLSSGWEYVYDNSTLFLVTSCTAPGIIPGSRVTLNPIDTSNTASQTQTANLDSSPGQKVAFTTSVAVAIQNDPGIVTSGIVPIVTDYPIPQQLFSQLVGGEPGTSAAPAVCLRLAGELDSSGNPMCKGFLLQCYNPADGTTTGDNCANAASELSDRYLFYNAQFNSPDAPVGYNFLTTQAWAASTPYTVGQTIVDSNGYVQQATAAGTSGSSSPSFSEVVGGMTGDGSTGLTWTNEGLNACGNMGPGTACAPGTGPGLLTGSDYWLCGPGSTPCNPPLDVSTSTGLVPATYSSSNCQFSLTLPNGNPSSLAGALCPLDVLTAVDGAADLTEPGTGKAVNSLFIPVVNMPLPTAAANMANGWSNGWTNNPAAAVIGFTSAAAAYAPSANNPPGNGFTPAAPYSLTYGVTAASVPLPDTTYPVAGDVANPNTDTTPNTPFCNSAGPGSTPSSFLSNTASGYFGTLYTNQGNGIYNLHYFTTDCAFTEGLVFNPTPAQVTNPTANWASFPYVTFGIDVETPTFTCTPNGGSYNANVAVQCTVTDPDYVAGSTGSGFGPTLPNSIQGSSASEVINISTNVPPGTSNPAAMAGPVQACDLANNCVSVQAGPFNIANQVQVVVTASSTNMTYGGAVPTITPSYTYPAGANQHLPMTPPTCSTNATSSSGVGGNPYTTSCSSAADPDYTFVYVSGTLTVNPASLTITASSTNTTYGATPPAVTPSYSAFAGSDTVASLTTAPTCTTTATNTTPAGTDTGANTCSGAVDGNYNIIYVPGNVIVGKASLTITASSTNMNYGGTPPAVTPSYSPFAGSDTVASLTTVPTCTTTATSSTPAGTDTGANTCSGAVDGNYNIIYVPGSVTVGKAFLTITASSTNMNYGGTPPAVTPSYSAFAGSDTVASLTTAPTCTTTATSSTPAGTDTGANTCSGAVDGNYNIAYVPGNVTVGKASLTITASSTNMTYGGTPPAVTPSYSAFAGSDTVASLTTKPTCSTTATNTTPAGTDTGANTCSGAVDGNYNFTYVAGNVTVGQAALVITASSPTITQGTTPVITASYNGFVDSQTASNLTTQPTCTTSATSSSPAGTYPTSCSGAVDPNYAISYVAGLLTITAPPTLTISPATWNFGPLYPGQSAKQTFTLTNPGTGSIAISKISIPGNNQDGANQPSGDPDDFQITNKTCGATLAAGAACTVTVTFTADSDNPGLPSPGSYAYLTVADNASGSPQTAYMRVTVINPKVQLSPTSLAFGTIATGQTSAAMKVTLTNTGTGVTPLTLGTISISPNYALASGTTCVNGGSVASGASCLIYVTFTPASSSSDPGTVTITDNALNSPQTIKMTGK